MFNETKAMINKARSLRITGFGFAAAAFLLLVTSSGSAQRDPFAKPSYKRERVTASTTPGGTKAGPAKVAPSYGPPAIEARIEYFKRLRETAAANGMPLPKVTSVLTLGEMAVTGIFKTPRGYAAMVEAMPIKLSYTIYPGEKFFDGQLVAVEENRLVFRKVTKVGEGKFVASVENKPLRQFTMKSEIEGTAPVQSDKGNGTVQTAKTEAPASAQPAPENAQPVDPATTGKKAAKQTKPAKPAGNPFLSPLDEMNNQPGSLEPVKAKKDSKKPVKVARKGNQK
jgi:hypothetical protein